MMQFTCQDCGADEWTVHGEIASGRPRVVEIRCKACGNHEDV